jgi:hypothetical protein
MGLNELVEKVTDPYERQARLWPALLALLPLIVLLSLIYTAVASVITNVAMLAGSCGMLYLLSNIARDRGKSLEPKLNDSWGGKPTTQLLRHRDGVIETVTKRRYHEFLSQKINASFPTADEEKTDPEEADEIYQSGVRWLLNQTRDVSTFGLLFKENIAYGFRRNALGMKPIGMVVSISSFIWIMILRKIVIPFNSPFIDFPSLSLLEEKEIVSAAFSLSMVLLWLFFFTKNATRRSAFTYAETLLRSCDVLEKK